MTRAKVAVLPMPMGKPALHAPWQFGGNAKLRLFAEDLQNALASGSFIVKVRAAISSADSGGFSVLTRKTIDS
jgi:hypothetical protein